MSMQINIEDAAVKRLTISGRKNDHGLLIEGESYYIPSWPETIWFAGRTWSLDGSAPKDTYSSVHFSTQEQSYYLNKN